jgi:hypothetical protein
MAHPNPSKTPKNNPKGKSSYGPAMQACTPFQRKYVEACFDYPDLGQRQVLWRMGYKGNEEACKKMAQRLMANPLVHAAMVEVGANVYRSKLPRVVNALDEIIGNKNARDRVKVLHGVLDRIGMHAIQEKRVTVAYDRESVIARIASVLERNQSLLPPTPVVTNGATLTIGRPIAGEPLGSQNARQDDPDDTDDN